MASPAETRLGFGFVAASMPVSLGAYTRAYTLTDITSAEKRPLRSHSGLRPSR